MQMIILICKQNHYTTVVSIQSIQNLQDLEKTLRKDK